MLNAGALRSVKDNHRTSSSATVGAIVFV